MLQRIRTEGKKILCLNKSVVLNPALQKTLLKSISCEGHGVHSGKACLMTLKPASVNSGIVFVRSDVKGKVARIPAQWDLVSDATMCTKLTNNGGISIGTIEHIVAACVGLGLTNVIIEVNGPEVPIMDGSSAVFVQMIQEAGLRVQKQPVKTIRILKPVEVKQGEATARLLPADEPNLTMKFNASGRLGKEFETYHYYPEIDDFVSLLSQARTFGFFEDAQKLWSVGLAQGASLENTIVIDNNKIMNEEGLRFEDELIRHKVLDALGDLGLAGARIRGRFEGVNSGHALNNKLLRALFADDRAWCVETPLPLLYR